MTTEGYERKPSTLTHKNESVTIYNSYEHGGVRILSIGCPNLGGQKTVMSICGLKQCNVNPHDFVNAPYLYVIPHWFSIICYDKDEKEIPYETRIKLIKSKLLDIYEHIDDVFYGDLSFKKGDMIKLRTERYYFGKSIVFSGLESLVLELIEPEIYIHTVKLLMRCDLFYKKL